MRACKLQGTVWQTLRRMNLGDTATLVGRPYEGNEIGILVARLQFKCEA